MSALSDTSNALLRDVETRGDVRDDPRWQALVGQDPVKAFLAQMAAKHLPGQHNQESHGNDHGVDVIPGDGALKGFPLYDADGYGKAYGDVVDEENVHLGGEGNDKTYLSVRFFRSGEAHVALDLPGGRSQPLEEMKPDAMRALADSIDEVVSGEAVDADNPDAHSFYIAEDGGDIRLEASNDEGESDYLDLSANDASALAEALYKLADAYDGYFGDDTKGAAKRYNEHQLRDPHTGEWIDTTPGDGGGKKAFFDDLAELESGDKPKSASTPDLQGKHLPGRHDQRDHGRGRRRAAAVLDVPDVPTPEPLAAPKPVAPVAVPKPPKPRRAPKPAEPDRPGGDAVADEVQDFLARTAVLAGRGKPEDVRDFKAGKMNGGIAILTYADGAKVVRKRHIKVPEIPGLDAKHGADAEFLGSLVGASLGLRTPAVHRGKTNTVLIEHIDSRTANAVGNDIQDQRSKTPEGARIALFDALIDNVDRNPSNWMVTSDGDIHLIDHGVAWLFVQGPPASAPRTQGVFAHRLISDGNPPKFRQHPFTKADIDEVKRRLESLRPEFEKLGRGGWLDKSLERADTLRPLARGTTDLIA